jgi:hypothetical protein
VSVHLRGSLLLVAAVAAVLASAPAAGASSLPPTVPFSTTLRGVHPLRLARVRERGAIERAQPRSCMADHGRAHTRVGAIERKVAPVACEQPPRSTVLTPDQIAKATAAALAALG